MSVNIHHNIRESSTYVCINRDQIRRLTFQKKKIIPSFPPCPLANPFGGFALSPCLSRSEEIYAKGWTTAFIKELKYFGFFFFVSVYLNGPGSCFLCDIRGLAKWM